MHTHGYNHTHIEKLFELKNVYIEKMFAIKKLLCIEKLLVLKNHLVHKILWVKWKVDAQFVFLYSKKIMNFFYNKGYANQNCGISNFT